MRAAFALVLLAALAGELAAEEAPCRPDEPKAAKYSRERALAYLDEIAPAWHQKHGCFSCHTNYAYLYARPKVDSPVHAEVRKQLEELVTKRWPDKGPRWDAEVVASAAALAFNDAATTGKLHPTTRVALDRMWTVQKDNGGWGWLKCGWPPMEVDDHYGVTLAALAVGVAPEGYAKTDAARAGMAKVAEYLRTHPPKHVHHQAMLLWAASYTPELMTEADRAATIRTLRDLQRPDGGWSAAGLGTWKRGDKKEPEPNVSDGYGTGFVMYVLRRAGVPADDPALRRGVTWLHENQRESGRWFARSLFRDNKHYLTHAGSAFAVMALDACEAP